MEKEKPPITENLPKFRATDAEIQAIIKSRHLDKVGMPLVEQWMIAMTIILITGVAQAQRDADGEWHEERTEQLMREIFEEIEKEFPEVQTITPVGTYEETMKILRAKVDKWQSLKSKYLQEDK